MSYLSTIFTPKQDNMIHVLEVDMIQTFSLKKGRKKFSTQGKKRVTKYFIQLHEMQTYFPEAPRSSPWISDQRH